MIDLIVFLATKYETTILKFAAKPSGGFLFYCPDDKTVFLTKRSAEMSSPGTYDIPGGRYDKGDNEPIDTANREAQEELGTLPRHKTLIDQYELPTTEEHPNRYVVFIYSIPLKEKEAWTPKVKIDHETSDFGWVKINDIPTNTHFDLTWIEPLLQIH